MICEQKYIKYKKRNKIKRNIRENIRISVSKR